MLDAWSAVQADNRARSAHPLADLETRDRTRVAVGEAVFGGDEPVIIAGPCSVESEQQVCETAVAVAASGAGMLRGGAFKPRTSPYSFQGLGEEGLRYLRTAGDKAGLPVVTEVLSEDHVALVAEYADMLQIGARNMQNFELLKKVSKCGKPLLLKRGAAATVKEWLLSAEYLLEGGNEDVVLCERGIRSYDPAIRNTLDLCAVALVKELSHLPVIVDPSHATGKRSLVPAMARAGLAAGADGLIVEVHPDPANALSDRDQQLTHNGFAEMMLSINSPAVSFRGREAVRQYRDAAGAVTR